jgi:hypothetical protein
MTLVGSRFLQVCRSKEEEERMTYEELVAYLSCKIFSRRLASIMQRIMYLMNFTMKYQDNPEKMPLTGSVSLIQAREDDIDMHHILIG